MLDKVTLWPCGLGVSLKECTGNLFRGVVGLEAGVYSNMIERAEGASSSPTEAVWTNPGAPGRAEGKPPMSRALGILPQVPGTEGCRAELYQPPSFPPHCLMHPSALSLPRAMSHN